MYSGKANISSSLMRSTWICIAEPLSVSCRFVLQMVYSNILLVALANLSLLIQIASKFKVTSKASPVCLWVFCPKSAWLPHPGVVGRLCQFTIKPHHLGVLHLSLSNLNTTTQCQDQTRTSRSTIPFQPSQEYALTASGQTTTLVARLQTC